MNCREFQKIIPDVLNHHVPVEQRAEVVEHLRSCKACMDELEINYVMQYGLSEDEMVSLDIVKHMEDDIFHMESSAKKYHFYKSLYILVTISAATSVIGSMIYCVFKVWF